MIEVRSIEVAGEAEGLLCTSDLEDHRPSPPKAVLELRVGCYGVRPEIAPGIFAPAPHGVMRLCAGCARKTINALSFMLSSITNESLPQMLGFKLIVEETGHEEVEWKATTRGVPVPPDPLPEPMEGFLFWRTSKSGGHSGRPRWKVSCERCGEVVHEATTGPHEQADYHARRDCKAGK